jgi:hypothetical protein
MMSIQVTKNRNNDSDACIISIIENIGIQFQEKDFILNDKSNNNSLLLLLEKQHKNVIRIPVLFLLGIVKNSLQKTNYIIELEEFCPYGLYCPYKTNPLKCPFNHHEMPHTILKNSYIPTLLCRYELYKDNGNKLKCHNPYCWYNHGKGRALRILSGLYHRY